MTCKFILSWANCKMKNHMIKILLTWCSILSKLYLLFLNVIIEISIYNMHLDFLKSKPVIKFIQICLSCTRGLSWNFEAFRCKICCKVGDDTTIFLLTKVWINNISSIVIFHRTSFNQSFVFYTYCILSHPIECFFINKIYFWFILRMESII